MGNIRNITVTDDRTRKAISNAFTDTILNNEGVFSGSDNAASNIVGKKCELINATVKKWYLGLDKIVITVNGSDVKADLNYPFMNPDYSICVVPEGTEAEDDEIAGRFPLKAHKDHLSAVGIIEQEARTLVDEE